MTPEQQREAIAKIRASLQNRKQPIDVLLVEDDHRDAELTVDRLTGFGLKTTWVRDTFEVQDHLSKNEPWLTFLDLKLGGGETSGLNVLDFIKSIRPESRVVILTGAYAHDSSECKESLKRGAIAVMLKPLTDEQVQLIFGTP